MLRITADHALTMRKKERALSFDLVVGFGLALVFHLVLAVGLKIAHVHDPNEYPILTPVRVEVELAMTHPHAAPIEVMVPVDLFSEPKFPEIPPPDIPVVTTTTFYEARPNFERIEKIEYQLLPDFEEEEDDLS
ncbi:MAG: hypothetical protein K940chlam9_00915 [Chlamydiae bacterium]|nr:hypothetical protein [Chlamydiota bacterium]